MRSGQFLVCIGWHMFPELSQMSNTEERLPSASTWTMTRWSSEGGQRRWYIRCSYASVWYLWGTLPRNRALPRQGWTVSVALVPFVISCDKDKRNMCTGTSRKDSALLKQICIENWLKFQNRRKIADDTGRFKWYDTRKVLSSQIWQWHYKAI